MQHDANIVATIMLVEDHPATRAAVMELVGIAFPRSPLIAAGSAEQALVLCASAAPDLIVMDIALPGMNGIDATRRIKALFPGTHVVVYSSYDKAVYRDESAAAGAGAFVNKSKVATELVPVSALLLASSPARKRD